jgi:hypothetical protein
VTKVYVPVAGALVLATSFLPWYRSRWAAEGDSWDSYWVTAWGASSQWILAVVLAVIATVLGLWNRKGWSGWLPPIVAATAVYVTLFQWHAIPPDGKAGATYGWFAYDKPHDTPFGYITRDSLVVVHRDGVEYDVGWGLYAGLAAMTLLLVLLAVRAVSGTRAARATTTRPEGPVTPSA